jgi:hypothetical protein
MSDQQVLIVAASIFFVLAAIAWLRYLRHPTEWRMPWLRFIAPPTGGLILLGALQPEMNASQVRTEGRPQYLGEMGWIFVLLLLGCVAWLIRELRVTLSSSRARRQRRRS